MVYVPGGEFMMGRNIEDGGDAYEHPAHPVTVRAFFIDANEVSSAEYKKFLDVNPLRAAPSGWVNRNYPSGSARKPVTGVDWESANAYASWSQKRLPSEEEWEFAARGPDGRLFPWGKEWKIRMANTGKPEAGADDGAKGMMPVGSYQDGKSPYGAYDMIGNAWEWTASGEEACSHGPKSALDSPELKVIRGGSWASRNEQATATFRRCYGVTGEPRGYSYTGFRLVQDIGNMAANR
jgi:formylglycine-generating enzyme required for sulfatase activity